MRRAGQIERLDVLGLEPLEGQAVGKVRRIGDGAAILADGLEPDARPAREGGRRQQNHWDVDDQGAQYEADQAHVMEER